jgi:hypothetical protein
MPHRGSRRAVGEKFGLSKNASIERTMVEKIERGTAINLAEAPRIGPYYVLEAVAKGQDYVDLRSRAWIRSIGKLKTGTGFKVGAETVHVKPGTILASSGLEFCAMAGVECVWQR